LNSHNLARKKKKKKSAKGRKGKKNKNKNKNKNKKEFKKFKNWAGAWYGCWGTGLFSTSLTGLGGRRRSGYASPPAGTYPSNRTRSPVV
jgi:hypothetical protein